jgi:hypothetical protein
MVTGASKSTFKTVGQEQRTVATVVQLLAGAVKHHSLYPENHSIAKQHLRKIFTTLNSYLGQHQDLHLTVHKTDILFDDEVVHHGQNDENDIAYLLGRDGIEWIEFLQEIEQWEIQALLRLINDNRRSDIDNDGNIATALWEKDLPHVEYKTLDLTALDIPMLNFQAFRVAPDVPAVADDSDQGDESSEISETEDEYQEEWETPSLALTAPDTSLWQLTELEQFQLDALIRKEEEGADTSSIIDILFILLLLQNDIREAQDIIEFLQDRFQNCLQQQQFKYALRILTTLKKIDSAQDKRQEQLHPLITDFFQAVSRPESLRDLEVFFISPDISLPENEIEALWKLLRILPEDVLKALALLSTKVDLQRFGLPFISLFELFGEKNPAILANIISDLDEKVCLLLFPLVNKIRQEHAVPIVTAMALHVSKPVRSKALQLLLKWDSVDARVLFPLIDDPDPLIHKTILSRIGQQRNPNMELMLCQHIQDNLNKDYDRLHILTCYQTLGKTGSMRCIPFLKKCLFQKSSLGTLFTSGGGAHKEGAALALVILQLEDAQQIVQEGASSLIPDVRSACRKALGGSYVS